MTAKAPESDGRYARVQKRIDESRTHITKVVAPGITNHHNTLFGGTLLAWMDEVAFITATRFGRCPFVTVSIDRTDFKRPIPAGSIVELIGTVEHVGRTSVRVRVDAWMEQRYRDEREKAVTGEITLVAIGEHHKPVPVEI